MAYPKQSPAMYSKRGTGTTPDNELVLSTINTNLESVSTVDQELAGRQSSDLHQTAINSNASLVTDSPIRVGRILLSLPYVHCYKVQISGRSAPTVATALTNFSMMPTGVRSGETLAPNSQVLIWLPKSGTLAYILGVIPPSTSDDSMNLADYIQQGGNSGPKQVEAVRNIPKAMDDSMSWVPQGGGRPIDGTHGEFVRMSETGIGILIDSFQAYLRVNEACGLWLNYFDNYAKLAALSLNITSYCEHNAQMYDEGENFALRGYCTFPWESTGMYSSGDKFSKANDKEKVQLDKKFPFAEEDVEDLAQTPVYRLTDYAGYMGQGWNRTLMKPAGTGGKRLMTDDDNDIGLFNEFLALDGSYSVRSAKQITLAKYPLIPNPRRIRAAEDAKGDDLTEDNDYRFSGEFGTGDEHKAEEWDTSAVNDLPNLMKPAGILDMMAHHYNWKSTYPFFYHKKDYRYPEESEGTSLSSVKFYAGRFEEAYVEIKDATSIKISDAYGDVDYYNTASFFSLTDDGSVVIGDGYGSQITMTGGQIRLEAGGDVMLMSGSRVVTLARESITRTKGSIDISSSDKDVRIKAENNLHMLGGGILIESSLPGISQLYRDKIGEEVNAGGISLLAKGSSVNLLSNDIYMRAGLDENGTSGAFGSVIVDVNHGKGAYANYANYHSFFNSNGLGIWHSPKGEDDAKEAIDKAHFFSPFVSAISGPTINQGGFVAIGDDAYIGAESDIFSEGGCYVLGRMACLDGWMGIGDSSQGTFAEQLARFFDAFSGIEDILIEWGKTVFDFSFKTWWEWPRPGNKELLENEIGFSFRDTSDTKAAAYGYTKDKFFMLETRYQQLDRAGLSSGGGQAWTESPVEYQGKELYPWPGKINWEDNDTFLKYKNGDDTFKLFDTGGFAKSREGDAQSDYEKPKFDDWDRETPSSGYKL
jgi:hypothetical protein